MQENATILYYKSSDISVTRQDMTKIDIEDHSLYAFSSGRQARERAYTVRPSAKVGTCESCFFVRIESRIESVVYHASRNTV